MNKTFPSSKDLLHDMMAFITSQAAALGFKNHDLERLELVAEEALINVISYAYKDATGNIEITCDTTPDKPGIKIVIADQGIPFDPTANAKKVDVDAPLEERTYGGYGIFLIQKVMDQVTYKREGDKNVLTLIKYL